MRRKLALLAALAATLLTLAPAPASAGQITLHPSGFGEHSYAAWKGQEGLPDSTGNKDQFLYFQKETSTTTFAAGVAVFKGVRGMSTADIVPLGFWYQADGHCGAGAPRFNVRLEGVPGTIFVGCAGMVTTDTNIDDQGDLWIHKEFAGPLPPGTVASLAIVYDEGEEFPPGHVFLDNIEVGSHLWTSASDNGNGGTTTANTAVTATELEAILGEPLAVAFGS